MSNRFSDSCTAFQGLALLHSGSRLQVALAVKRSLAVGPEAQILAFDDATGQVVDFDLRGNDADIAERLASPPPSPRGSFRHVGDIAPEAGKPKRRGRPRLGVVAREVTLLPRHWEWLATQRGGASATLRRLVDEARKQPDEAAQERAARESAYAFLHAIAGDLPKFEEVTRALFAEDTRGFERQMADWPKDIRDYALRLATRARVASLPETDAED